MNDLEKKKTSKADEKPEEEEIEETKKADEMPMEKPADEATCPKCGYKFALAAIKVAGAEGGINPEEDVASAASTGTMTPNFSTPSQTAKSVKEMVKEAITEAINGIPMRKAISENINPESLSNTFEKNEPMTFSKMLGSRKR